ncbi:hypothetical protein ACQ5SP_05515 [Rhodovulum sp. YNF3179]|uniref:hypothetical protein n=1 Tax=Rhodovulum sp. YNF3179 TaxID=3425127 RepID=UPI003D341E37
MLKGIHARLKKHQLRHGPLRQHSKSVGMPRYFGRQLMHSITRAATIPTHMARISAIGGLALADGDCPTEHRGLKVARLGVIPAGSMARQVGRGSHVLLLRRITIEPGGPIAHHGAAKVPGAVYKKSGAWTEGWEGGEAVHKAGETFIEDADTVHWCHNRGGEITGRRDTGDRAARHSRICFSARRAAEIRRDRRTRPFCPDKRREMC